MTTNERINMISNKRNQLDAKAKADTMTEDFLRENLSEQIRELKDRIQNVLAVGNALRENGFLAYNGWNSKDERLLPYGYNGAFLAEGIYHHVGFMSDYRNPRLLAKYPISSLGIRMGGACGAYDLWTDGEFISSVHESNKSIRPVPVEHLKQFLREFPKFEAAFYAWVDANMV